MQVIPVLDLLGGHAVHAVRGERSRYRPIRSTLCATSEPLSVARALLSVTQAPVLYVADLDAILGRGDHAVQLAALCDALGDGASLWLDAGFTDFASMQACFARVDARATSAQRARILPVFGSETLLDLRAIADARAAGFDPVLSLDYRGGARLGDIHADASLWPSRVIVMTLDRVGAASGPDLSTFADVRASGRRSDVQYIGAGGVRGLDDLRIAEGAGAWAWLVASALHEGAGLHRRGEGI